MARPLDILILEPYFGGVRQNIIELWQKHSRHRWKLHKLPARRLDRRLVAGAQWFAEQLSRHQKSRYDIVFTSDALNLADLVRLVPSLAGVPSVLYVYRDFLANYGADDGAMTQACLASANTASEIWFPSLYVLKAMLSDAAALADTHPEMGGRAPLKRLVAKAQIVYPPIDAKPPSRAPGLDAARRPRCICLDNRVPCPEIYLPFLEQIMGRDEPVEIQVLGDALTPLPAGINATTVAIRDESDLFRVFQQAEIFVTSEAPAVFDPVPLQAMAAGCIPLMPRVGFFQEYLPAALHRWCLFDPNPEDLHSKVMDLWYLRRPAVEHAELTAIFDRYQPAHATGLLDDRLEQLASHVAE